MPYSAKAVANYILGLGRRDNGPVTPMALQKLVYIAHGWHLALTQGPLVSDEHPEAWDYGPVFPSLYYEFRSYGSGNIPRPASELVLYDDGEWRDEAPTILSTDAVTTGVVGRVWEEYSHLDGFQLSDLTHQPGSPWYQTRLKASGYRNTVIPDDLIEGHFLELAWKNREYRAQQIA